MNRAASEINQNNALLDALLPVLTAISEAIGGMVRTQHFHTTMLTKILEKLFEQSEGDSLADLLRALILADQQHAMKLDAALAALAALTALTNRRAHA